MEFPSRSQSQQNALVIRMQTGRGTVKTGDPHLATYDVWSLAF